MYLQVLSTSSSAICCVLNLAYQIMPCSGNNRAPSVIGVNPGVWGLRPPDFGMGPREVVGSP